MLTRVTRRGPIAQLRAACRFYVFGVKVTRLCFPFRGFVLYDRCGWFVLTAPRVVKNVNGPRRVFFRDVRRVRVYFRA